MKNAQNQGTLKVPNYSTLIAEYMRKSYEFDDFILENGLNNKQFRSFANYHRIDE